MSTLFKVSGKKSAFTLLEVMVATTLFGIVIASIISTFIIFAKGSESLAQYVEMSMDSRRSLETCARDIRSGEEIHYATTNAIVLQYPDNTFYDGSILKYEYDDSSKFYTRYVYDKSATVDSSDGSIAGTVLSEIRLLEGVEEFAFNFYDPLGKLLDPDSESLLLSIKSIQIDAKMQRAVTQTTATDYIISARFLMRNRTVTE